MISIRKLLETQEEDGLLHIVQLLLQGIWLHALEGAPEDYARFRDQVQGVFNSLDSSTSFQELHDKTGAVVKAMGEYNIQTAEYLGRRVSDFRNMVALLSATIGSISSSGNENIARLREIEQQVVSATQVEDLWAARQKLNRCLEGIRTEAERQKIDNHQAVQRLNLRLERAREESSGPPREPDGVTGLPPRPAAETALGEACSLDVPAYVGVVVIERIAILNARFGRDIGDQVLRLLATSLRARFSSEDELFRWSGPALLAVLVRPGGLAKVRYEISQIMSAKIEHKASVRGRDMTFPVATRWAVFPTTVAPRLITRQVDEFAALRPAYG